MKRFISFGICNPQYMIMLIIFIFILIFEDVFVEQCDKNKKSKLLDPLLYYIGCILCLFPLLIKKKISKSDNKNNLLKNRSEETNKGIIEYIYNNPYEQYLTSKDLIMVIIVSLLILAEDFCEITLNIIDSKEKEEGEEQNVQKFINNEYFFIEVLIWFFFSKYFLKITHYKHQNIAIIGIMIIGIIRSIYIFYNNISLCHFEIIKFFLNYYQL